MKKILFISLAIIAVLAVSCSKQKLADLNKDVKHPADVPGNTLFSNAEKSLSDQDVSINVNVNDFDLWAQYLTETTYTDEANFDIFNRSVPDRTWRIYYHLLLDLNRSDSLIKLETVVTPEDIAMQKNRITIIDILSCYAWDQIETTWGNIPYTQAMDINNVLPKYDDALTIHKDLIARVTADISALDLSHGSFDGADLIYSGGVAGWQAFANGLLVKMAIEIADVTSESALVQTTIQNAMGGAISSASGNAMFNYRSGVPNNNPLYSDLVLSGRSDYVAANTIIDAMNSLNDPRLPLYFDDNMANDSTYDYVGGSYGESSAFPNFTHINPAISNTPDFPHALMTYSEMQFYFAEAAARGIISGDAATYYNNAVTASIEFWGGSSDAANAYLGNTDVAYDPANWKERIGTQAWISFYLRGYTAFTEWRRLDFPVMNEPPSPAAGVVTFPFRYPYPSGEQTLNGANYTTAAAAIGGDIMDTKLYWDKN